MTDDETSYKPNFTREQKDFICWQIGEWYLIWKNKLIDYDDRTHKLGFAKEQLKLMVCDDMDEFTKELNDFIEKQLGD